MAKIVTLHARSDSETEAKWVEDNAGDWNSDLWSIQKKKNLQPCFAEVKLQKNSEAKKV